MFAKLAGHTPLADMISQIIDDSRSKIAAAEGGEEKDDKKPNPFFGKKDDKKKDDKPKEKGEEKGEDKGEEKKASAIDFTDSEDVEKLASALDQVGEELIKEADSEEHGGESKGGGTSLPVMSPVAGKQPYKKDGSKHESPKTIGLQSGGPGTKASTQIPSDVNLKAAPNYPKKGVMKTAAETVLAKMKAEAEGAEEAVTEKPKAASVVALEDAIDKMAGLKDTAAKGAKAVGKRSKMAAAEESPVDFILDKMAGSTEKRMGGMTLDSKSGDGPKPPSNPGREMIASNTAPVSATKAKAKAPQKKLMSQVLTEPMQSKSNDSKVSENLRNASKGGVKIAAAREFLKKIASEGCSCDGQDECKYCKMKKSMSSSTQA